MQRAFWHALVLSLLLVRPSPAKRGTDTSNIHRPSTHRFLSGEQTGGRGGETGPAKQNRRCNTHYLTVCIPAPYNVIGEKHQRGENGSTSRSPGSPLLGENLHPVPHSAANRSSGIVYHLLRKVGVPKTLLLSVILLHGPAWWRDIARRKERMELHQRGTSFVRL